MSDWRDTGRYWVDRCREVLGGTKRPIDPAERAPAPPPDDNPELPLIDEKPA